MNRARHPQESFENYRESQDLEEKRIRDYLRFPPRYHYRLERGQDGKYKPLRRNG